MTNCLLEKALEYADRGWYVFPAREKPSEPFMEDGEMVVRKVKSPYIKGGFTRATIDKQQIINWWKKYPEAGIGISCGHSNLTVIDIDVRDGKRGFDSFMKMNIPDENCFHAITPSGGLHIIFSGVVESHLGQATGIDIRSHGAYYIAPPSYIYEDGKKKSYIAVDDWSGTPKEVPSDLSKRWDELRGRIKKENKRDYSREKLDVTIEKVKKALDKIDISYCDEYSSWINIGLACKTLGEAGFQLWDSWSQKSSKYDPKACSYRWKRFDPREIGIGTIMYYANEGNE